VETTNLVTGCIYIDIKIDVYISEQKTQNKHQQSAKTAFFRANEQVAANW
jgi:hypothetical protein